MPAYGLHIFSSEAVRRVNGVRDGPTAFAMLLALAFSPGHLSHFLSFQVSRTQEDGCLQKHYEGVMAGTVSGNRHPLGLS